MIPRCNRCQKRHADDWEECAEPGAEGYIPRAELLDAFRAGDKVCLACQAIWSADQPGNNCPSCGEPFEQFGEDDLEG